MYPSFKQEEQQQPLNLVKKIITYSLWDTQSTPFCCWYCRANRQITQDAFTDEFVLEFSNSHSCVFNTILRIPTQYSLKMVVEKGAKFVELFKLSQNSVKMVLLGKPQTRSS